MLNYRYGKNLGFTLIELLVVIAIIGILASVVLASLNSARTKAADTARFATVKQIQSALEFYYDDNLIYPLHSAGVNNSGYAMTNIVPLLSPYYSNLSDPNAYIQYVRSTNSRGYGIRVYSQETSSWCLITFGESTTAYWWSPPMLPTCGS